jgi:hypothetical protein
VYPLPELFDGRSKFPCFDLCADVGEFKVGLIEDIVNVLCGFTECSGCSANEKQSTDRHEPI